MILAFIRKVWSDAETDRILPDLTAAALDDLPDIADLVDDQAAGRLPRWPTNSCTELRT